MMCAHHVYMFIRFCSRLFLEVLLGLSFRPFTRLSLPSLEIESWSTRVVVL